MARGLTKEQQKQLFRKLLFGTTFDPKTRFKQPKETPAAVFGWLKNEPFEIGRYILRDFSSPSSPYHQTAFGQPIVKAYKELRFNHKLTISDKWDKEMAWTIHAIEAYSETINELLTHKEAFEIHFTKGDYSSARRSLDSAEQISVSYWSLQCRFLLEEYTGGLEANKSLLSQFNQTNEDIGARLLANVASDSAERKMSAARYEQRVRSINEGLIKHEVYSFAAFFTFLSGVFRSVADLPLVDILYWAWSCPVFDRFLTVIQLGQRMAASDRMARPTVYSLLAPLATKIDSYSLKNLLLFCNPGLPAGSWISCGIPLLPVIDKYTEGAYDETVRSAQVVMEQFPHCFEPYELLAKARCFAAVGCSGDIDVTSVPIASILQHVLFTVYAKSGLVGEAVKVLAKLSYSLRNFPLSNGMISLVSEEQENGGRGIVRAMAELNSHFANPRFADIFDDPHQASGILTELLCAVPESTTVRLWVELYEAWKSVRQPVLPPAIPESRRLFYIGLVLQKVGDHTHAIDCLKQAISKIEPRDNFYALGAAIKALLNSYLKVHNIPALAALVTDAHFRNPNLLSGIPAERIQTSIMNATSDELWRDINVPIAVYLTSTHSRTVHAALDNFLQAQGAGRATDLLPNSEHFSPRELTFCLKNICTLDILSHSVHYESSSDLHKERLGICQYLSTVDSAMREEYNDEISQITQRLLINTAVQQVEQSKIFVDIPALKAAAASTLAESFDRYLEIREFQKDRNLVFLETDLAILGMQSKTSKDSPKIYLLAHPRFVLFKELFLEVRDRFIGSSEYGLDSYLSVRIRHGTLLGQLRRPFEAHHLVTRKDKSTNAYLLNSFWLLPDVNANEATQSALAKISQGVDELTTEVKERWIQIITEGTPDRQGMFDYSYLDVELNVLLVNSFSDVQTYSEFIDTALTELWNVTELNLGDIRQRIQGELKQRFLALLNTAHESVRKVDSSEPLLVRLAQSIASCRTDIQHEVDFISEWFTLGERKHALFGLDQLVKASIEIINRTYPEAQLKPRLDLDADAQMQGVNFAPLVDILLVLFTNVYCHSGFSGADTRLEVFARYTAEVLEITVRNAVADRGRALHAESAMSTITKRMEETSNMDMVRREGGTGFAKIHKLLKFDLRRKNYSVCGRGIEGTPWSFEVMIKMDAEGLL